MFPDTIEVNFSLTMDPYNRRKPDIDANLFSTVMVYSVGNTSSFGSDSDWPLNNTKENPIVLGRFEKVKISTQVLATACNSEISLKNPFQQIQSSFVMNWTSISEPANVLSSTASWFAPIRSGPHWIDSYWIQIDFLTIMRLTKFQLKQPDLYRVVTIARLN